MSNQNNSMQKMPVISNVNLSRYKKNIDGEIKVNETNMAVIGNKFNPITKENTGMNFAHLMETKEGIKGYDDNGYYYNDRLDSIKVDPQVKKVAVLDDGYIYEKRSGLENEYYFKDVYSGIEKKLFTGSRLENENKAQFATWVLKDTAASKMYFVASDSVGCVLVLDGNIKTYNLINYPVISVFLLPNLSTYSSSTNFTYNTANGYTPAVLYNNNGVLKLKVLRGDAQVTDEVIVDSSKWFPIGGFISGSDWNSIFAYYNFEIHQINVTAGSVGAATDIVNAILAGFGTSATTSIVINKINDQKNGWIFNRNIQFKGPNNFIMNVAFSYVEKSCKYDYAHDFLSIENGKLVDNFPMQDKNKNWLQGVDIIQTPYCSIDIINQNYMYFKMFNPQTVYSHSFQILDRIRVKNDNWYRISRHGEKIPSYDFAGKIYHHQTIVDKYDHSTTRNTFESIRLWSDILTDMYFRAYTNETTFIQNCRYFAIGSSVIPDDNMYLPQLAPISIDFITDRYNINNPELLKLIFTQKNINDATLTNSEGDVYIAPTDEDFYIPIMPSDKVVNKNQNSVIIERLDGSKAELLKFNNKIYPIYLYSSIVNNVDYSFICQGQTYNIINGVITDSDGTGIVDVSDQIYLGCNGVIALFYNERNKSIYQFSASNGLDMLFESDNIETITKVDISNTNDEIYIGYKNYDNEYNLLCIENDGSSYIVDNDFMPEDDFFVGKKGIYIKGSGEGSTWMLHRLLVASDNMATKNNYIETNYFGTDEFKLMNVDRIYLRFNKTTESEDNQEIIVNLSMLTLDDEINEQYTIEPVGDKIYRIAPRQKQCIGIKIRIDGLTNYTLTALSIGVTDDSNVVTDNTVNNNQLDASIFD